MLNRYAASEGGLAGLVKSGQSTRSDTMNEIIMGLNRLERRIGMDGEAVRIQLDSISNCLSENENAKYHHWRINTFEETLASVSEK